MLGSCLQAQYSISNSVRVWCVSMGWTSSWTGHWSAIPSVFDPFLSLHLFIYLFIYLFIPEQFWVKNLKVGWCPYPSTGGPVYLLDVVSSGSISSLLGISAKVTTQES